MGTHPIFESDFDCLTDLKKMNSTKIGIALNQKRKVLNHLCAGIGSKRHLFGWFKSKSAEKKPEGRLVEIFIKSGLPWDQEKYGKKEFLEWEGGTTMPPQYRYTYLMLFVVITFFHTVGKEARGRGGFLYDSWFGETFVSKLAKERRERQRIYSIIYEIKAIEAAEVENKRIEEERIKEAEKSGVFVPKFDLEEEIFFYEFPGLPLKGNEEIPLVKIPVLD